MFDGFKARLDRLFAEHDGRTDPRARAGLLREALIEAKSALATLRDARLASERELEAERAQLAAAERRGRLAAEVPDAETVAIAERYATKHRERIGLLEKKLAVQAEELAIAERDVAEMTAQYRDTRQTGAAAASVEAAWRDLEAAGGVRPETDLDGELRAATDERKRYEAAVDAQLAHLKKKLGKE